MNLTERAAKWRQQHDEWFAQGDKETPPSDEEALRMVVFEAINDYLDAYLKAIEDIDCVSDGTTFAEYEDHVAGWLDLYCESDKLVHTGEVKLLPIFVGHAKE